MQSGEATGSAAVPEFTTCDDYSNFSHYVKATARHILDSNSQKFVDTVIATANKRSVLVAAGTHLWRA